MTDENKAIIETVPVEEVNNEMSLDLTEVSLNENAPDGSKDSKPDVQVNDSENKYLKNLEDKFMKMLQDNKTEYQKEIELLKEENLRIKENSMNNAGIDTEQISADIIRKTESKTQELEIMRKNREEANNFLKRVIQEKATNFKHDKEADEFFEKDFITTAFYNAPKEFQMSKDAQKYYLGKIMQTATVINFKQSIEQTIKKNIGVKKSEEIAPQPSKTEKMKDKVRDSSFTDARSLAEASFGRK